MKRTSCGSNGKRFVKEIMEVRLTKFEEELIKRGKPQNAFDSMLSRFNGLVQASGLFKELKERESFKSRSSIRSKKKKNKLAKCRKETREYALHEERVQREGGFGGISSSKETTTDRRR